MLLGFREMVLYFTNTGVRKVVVNKNAILHSWSLVDLQTLQHRFCNICFCSVVFLLVETIGIFGTDRAYRPRDRYTDHWEL